MDRGWQGSSRTFSRVRAYWIMDRISATKISWLSCYNPVCCTNLSRSCFASLARLTLISHRWPHQWLLSAYRIPDDKPERKKLHVRSYLPTTIRSASNQLGVLTYLCHILRPTQQSKPFWRCKTRNTIYFGDASIWFLLLSMHFPPFRSHRNEY
jgi:hypothetical protein